MSIFRNYEELVETRGCVVREWEKNGYDDSDFFAIVYNPKTEKFDEIMWGTTRFASIGHGDNCVVDATPEIMEKYNDHMAKLIEISKIEMAKIEAATPRVGKTVKSLTTRGKAFGKLGRVFWIGPNKYRTYYSNGYNRPENNLIVGVDCGSEKVFIPIDKCEVI